MRTKALSLAAATLCAFSAYAVSDHSITEFPRLAGATALSFAPGASLSIGAAEVEDSAAVSVIGATDANLLRIGSSKCLTRAEREHFTVNGCEATQDTDGWVVPRPGFRIIIR